MSRGRLIFPKLAGIARYSPDATRAIGGFDELLRENVVTNPNDGSARTVAREEMVELCLRAQIETATFQRLALGPLGNAPGSALRVVVHGYELEELGLLDPVTKRGLLKVTDRLHAIYELDGALILQMPPETEGAFYATQVQPCGFGFGSGPANLYELSFDVRPPGTQGGGGG